MKNKDTVLPESLKPDHKTIETVFERCECGFLMTVDAFRVCPNCGRRLR